MKQRKKLDITCSLEEYNDDEKIEESNTSLLNTLSV